MPDFKTIDMLKLMTLALCIIVQSFFKTWKETLDRDVRHAWG